MNPVMSEHLTNDRPQEPLACVEVERISDDLFFIAANSAMRKLRSQIELLAQVDVPVFITGENGSGKELTARLVHKLSARSREKFAAVNCAAVPEEILEGDLFGQERGIVNGSTRPRLGKFELCQKGTILLESVTDMPWSVQTKLLHVLQDRQFSRVGGDKGIPADVRVLAASDANISKAVAEKKLREDLYYRLSAFTINVPPLRQRSEELPLLLTCFMRQLARQFGLPTREFSPAVLAACQQHSWPGNLRELENFVKRYLVIGDEDVALDDLKTHPTGNGGLKSFETEPAHPEPQPLPSLKSLVESAKSEAERSAISAALDQTRWNRKAAARLLKVSYRSLLYKIEQYRMTPPAHFSSLSPEQVWKGNRLA